MRSSCSATATSALPVAIIGAGPVGLAAAAHLLLRGETPLVLEAGDAVGAHIAQWGHVRFFSPWKYAIDTASRTLLDAQGWVAPNADDFPTGRELVADYLAPLAATPQLAPHIRLGARVVAVTRRGFDKMKTEGRDDTPFQLHIRTAEGRDETLLARAVIDASGSWGAPNPLGASGIPAIGERALADHIAYGIPDILGAERTRYAGRRILVAGSGHSAFNAIVDLAELARQEPGTSVIWTLRKPADGQIFGGAADDALPERGALGQRVRALAESGALRMEPGFKTLALRRKKAGLVVTGERDGAEVSLPPVDEIIVATGFRPDLASLAELRVALDPATESPVALAPLIDPNVHSCGTVPPHGAVELAHPERDFYIVGMKSYGRAPTFLLLTGYEQVRSVAAALLGDWEAARDVQLTLPETGVCSSGCGLEDTGSCCATTAQTPLPTLSHSGKPLGIPVVAGSAKSASAGGCCAK